MSAFRWFRSDRTLVHRLDESQAPSMEGKGDSHLAIETLFKARNGGCHYGKPAPSLTLCRPVTFSRRRGRASDLTLWLVELTVRQMPPPQGWLAARPWRRDFSCTHPYSRVGLRIQGWRVESRPWKSTVHGTTPAGTIGRRVMIIVVGTIAVDATGHSFQIYAGLRSLRRGTFVW